MCVDEVSCKWHMCLFGAWLRRYYSPGHGRVDLVQGWESLPWTVLRRYSFEHG